MPTSGTSEVSSGPFAFAAERGYAADIPLEFAAIDLGAAECASADRVFLQRRAATRAMQRRGLLRSRRKHVALAFQLPTLAHVIAHFTSRIPFSRSEFGVVRVKLNADSNSGSIKPAHVHDLHRADDDSLHRFQIRWV